MSATDQTRKLLENALVAIELMQQKLDALTSAQREPIAIVGAACRFPGGVHDLPSYWRMLQEGRSGVSDLGRRFELDDDDRDPDAQGKIAFRWGGLLDDIEHFDAQFFGVSPKAALCMDPQQRLMLEVAWEAIENAGYDPMNPPSKQAGVFVATGPNEYAPLLLSKGLGMEPSANMATGNSASVVAGRLSYLFGWMGPAVVIDTACSSSLVAVHMACQSLRSRECDLAIAGGVNLMVSPLSTVVIGKNGMLAADDRCKVFDASADGYIRSEGAAILAFKRLSDACADRDHILAVVRGSAVTHNGRSQGITAPSAASQEAVIGKALAQAGLTADAVSYVEAHGTGTALGDPIEVASLAATYGIARAGDRPLLVGSVKANIGHCETVAGAAGLLKLVLCLQHRSIPPQINLTRISPHLEQWLQGDGPMRVARTEVAWPGESPRIGAVSSFGFSGTNAHAIVEQAPDIGPAPIPAERDFQLLTLSAKTSSALRELALRYADVLRQAADSELGNICFTANTGRARFSHRLAAWGDREALIRALIELGAGRASQNGGVTAQASGQADAVTFCFAGKVTDPVLAGRAYLAGAPIDFAATHEGGSYRRVPLPTYPFARKRYWPDGEAQKMPKAGKLGPPAELTEVELEITDSHPLRLADHRLAGEMVVPGAAHLAMAFEAVARTRGKTDIAFVNVAFPRALALAPDTRRIARYRFSLGAKGRINCRGESRDAADDGASPAWTWHLAADLLADSNCETGNNLEQVPGLVRESSISLASASRELSNQQFYDRLEQFGYQLGPSFRWVASAKSGPASAIAALHRPEATDATSSFPLSATLLDTCFQVASAALPAGLDGSGTKDMYLPFSIDRIQLSHLSGEPTSCIARLRPNPESGNDDLVHDIAILDESARPLLCIEGFRSRRWAAGEADGTRATPLAYDIGWREVAQPAASSGRRGEWLIFNDGAGVGDALAKRLRGEGTRVHCVRPGDELRLTGENLRIDPGNPEDMRRLLAHMPNFNGALHLWALDLSGTAAGVSDRRVAASTWLGILHFAQALTGIPRGERQLWICTRQNQAVLSTDRIQRPEAATLWGLGRTLMQEVRDLQTVLVDLDRHDLTGTEQVADRLHRELGIDAGAACERALRGERRYEPRLLPRAASAVRAPVLRADVTYLITGGLGGLGLACAERFIEWGARNLALLSRNRPSDSALLTCRELERRGAVITHISADVASRDALKTGLEEIRARGPKLAGIVHAAGVLNDGVMVRQSGADFEEVMRPKLAGTWNLHELTQSDALDFFILFSSVAALLGSPAQASYAAANAYLDALTLYRRAHGLPATTVAWGAWSEIGMAAGSTSRTRSAGQHTHLAMMSPRQALDLFAAAFDPAAPPSIAIGNLSAAWLQQVRQRAASVPAMLRDLVASSGPREVRQTSAAPVGADLERLPLEQRKSALEAYVASEVRLVLGLAADQELDPVAPLLDSGLDSLAAIELRDRLAQATSAVFPASLLFDNPSIARLADVILSVILPDPPGTTTGADQAVATSDPEDDGLEELSATELHSLLAEELRSEIHGGWP